MDLIWYPHYVEDYARDTSGLSLLEHGAYRVLLDEYYRTRKPLEANAERLHRICRANTPDERAAIDYVVARYFVLTDAGWVNARADSEIQRVAELSAKRSSAAKNRGNSKSSANAEQVRTQPHLHTQLQKKKKNTSVESDDSTGGGSHDSVQCVFEHWQQVHNHPTAKLGHNQSKRYRAIAGRLKDGYTVAELCSAVDGCKKSAHHMGQNDSATVYDDIELICRDGAHVDKFIRLAAGPDLSKLSAAGRATARAGQEWLEESEARDAAN